MLNDNVIYRAEKGDTIEHDSYAAEAQGFMPIPRDLRSIPW